jgi:O-antigen/teichoic acid export membrane protein
MQRKFLSNLAFLLLVNLLIKPLWIFGVDRTVQNEVGADSYGLYFAIFNFSFLFSMLLDFGINSFNNRAIAQHEGLLSKLLPNIFLTKWLLALIYVIVTAISALALNFDSEQMHLLWFMIVNQVLISFILYFRSNLSALHLFKVDALLSVLDKALMIAIIGILLWGNIMKEPFRIEWLVYGQTGALAVTALVSLMIVMTKAGGMSLKWDSSAFWRILRLSFPFALLGVLMSIYSRIDAVMIERMLGARGDEEAGIYAASYRILDFFSMTGFAFATILLPMFARMIKRKEDVSNLIAVSGRLILSISVIVVCTCYFYSHDIMYLLYTGATDYWARMFGWLMVSFIGVSAAYIFGTLLSARGSIWQMNAMAVGSVLLNIGLNLVLIPKNAALGATVATVITQLLAAAVQVLICIRLFRFNLKPQHVLGPMVFIVLTVGAFWAFTFLDVLWWFALALSAVVASVAAFGLRMVDLRSLKAQQVSASSEA